MKRTREQILIHQEQLKKRKHDPYEEQVQISKHHPHQWLKMRQKMDEADIRKKTETNAFADF